MERVVVGVLRFLHDPAGSGSTPPGVQVLQGAEYSANSALSRKHHPLQSPPILRGAVAEQGSNAPCQDALHRTSVEGLKDPLGDSELPQLPEVVEAPLRLPHQSVNVGSPSQILCDVDSQVPEVAHPFHRGTINPQWCVSTLMLFPPQVHNQLLSFGDIQYEAVVLAP